MVRMAVGFAAIVAPLQLLIGDQHGLNTLEHHQQLKIAAVEAHWGRQPSGRARATGLARRQASRAKPFNRTRPVMAALRSGGVSGW
jgi:cytochrome bd-type quinol oxidase subunit 1